VRKGKKQIEELLHWNAGIESAEDFAAPRSNQPSSRCQHGTQLTLTKEMKPQEKQRAKAKRAWAEKSRQTRCKGGAKRADNSAVRS